MSHFSVIVVGKDIEGQLEKYNEQSETKEFMEFEDNEDELLIDFQTGEIDVVQLSDGTVLYKHDSTFEITKGFQREYVYPENSIHKKMPFKEFYENFDKFAEDWHGYTRDESTGRYGNWSNPNAKWDYYVVGGRWSNFFKHINGKMVNSLLVSELDFEGMELNAIERANKEYDALEKALGGLEIPSWKKVLEECGEDLNQAREVYNNLEAVKRLYEASFFCFGDLFETYGPNREAFIQRAIDAAYIPYALVKDGKWTGKGDMGWWGFSQNKIDDNEWNRQVKEAIKSLDPDTLLTMVDCHI